MTHSDSLHLLAPAKINLFLHVVGRRPDGYHLLQSAFELIDWADELHLRLAADGSVNRAGDLLGPVDDDLAVRAARALQQTRQWQTAGRPGANILVRKAIPSGAGLGGGSSDAATTLMGLNRLWGLGLGREQLSEIGLSLGADVPFFLFGQAAFVEGIGEQLQAYTAAPRWVLVAVPACHVATARIFAAPELTRNSKPLKIAGFAQAAQQPVWEFGRNDLEAVTKAHFPEVGRILDWLSQAAASEGIAPAAVRMSGSGGAVFCTAPSAETAHRLYDRMNVLLQSLQGDRLTQLRVCQTLMQHPEQAL